MCLACDGRVAEAVVAGEQAIALEPLSPLVHYLRAASLSFVGRFADAEGASRRVLELQGDSFLGWTFLSLALVGQGRFAEAVGTAERLLTSSPSALWIGVTGLVYAKAGRTADARRLLAELDERAMRGEYIAPFGPLAIQVGLGDVAEIRRLLEVCVVDRVAPLSLAATSGPFLEAYRTDPEINRLIDAIFDITPAASV
jgi:tetratricopeptide (TPR) repeat protein